MDHELKGNIGKMSNTCNLSMIVTAETYRKNHSKTHLRKKIKQEIGSKAHTCGPVFE